MTLDAWPGDLASAVVAVATPVGQLWIGAIRMTVVPLVVALMFVSVASRDESRGLGRAGLVTTVAFFGLLVFSAFIALLVVPPLMADLKLSADAATALRGAATEAPDRLGQLPGFAAWLTSLVPTNVVQAAANGAMLPLIVFTLAFAIAARSIDEPLRDALVSFFGAVASAMTRIVEWVIAVGPIGIFALVLVAASKAGASLAGAMLYYVMGISLISVLFALLLYTVATVAGGVPLREFVRAVFPAQAVALSSSSSLASLPALVEGARRLRLATRIGGFVLPLAVSTFKVATPITWLVGTAFLARLYGVTLETSSYLTIVLLAIVLSLTTPGVPQGAQLMLAPLLTGLGIPAEGIGLLIAVDTIPDLFGTMTNVTGDLVAGTVVARYGVVESAESEPEPASTLAEVES